MRKFDAYEIIKLLDLLIGPTEAVGESNADERAMENLKVLIDITNWCLDGILHSSETSGAVEYSRHMVGFHAKCAMEEYLRWFQGLFDEEGNESERPDKP